MEKKHKLMLVTTVPETLDTILRDQPRRLNVEFDVVIVSSDKQNLFRIARREGVKGLAVPMERGINLLQDFCSLIGMVWVLVKEKPDMLHSYTPKAGLIAMLAGWVCRVPIRVHTFTGLLFPTASGFKKRLLTFIDRLICGCATVVVPEGLGVKIDLERFNITRKPMSIIGHGNIAGVDTGFYSRQQDGVSAAAKALRAQLGVDKNDFLFCFIGRINRDKGISELVSAFCQLPERAKLIIVGAVDSTAPIASAVMDELKSNSRIITLGFLEDIRPALMISDVLVLPSYREGFPNVILQAGSMSVPAIATDINGSNEIIFDGSTGWLVKVRDSLDLGRKMLEVMNLSQQTLEFMGVAIRTSVCNRFERADHWDRLLKFYRSLVMMSSKLRARPDAEG